MPVTWKTVWLREPQELTFPNYEPFVIAVKSADFDDLSVKFSYGAELTLAGAVDSDERFEWPRLHLFAGNDPGELLFFGGPAAYRVRSDSHIAERLVTHRDLASYGCGRLDVITQQDIAVIVYEVGILVIGDDLRQRWLRRKYMGPHRIAVEDGVVWLREPHMIPIGHRLSDGETVSAPEGYSPGVPRGRVPEQRELFEECVKAWDREAVMSALQAISSELAKLAQTNQGGGADDDRRLPRSLQIDELRRNVSVQIQRMSADTSARPDHGFAADLATQWHELGLDPKRLLGIAMAGVYKWRVP